MIESLKRTSMKVKRGIVFRGRETGWASTERVSTKGVKEQERTAETINSPSSKRPIQPTIQHRGSTLEKIDRQGIE